MGRGGSCRPFLFLCGIECWGGPAAQDWEACGITVAATPDYGAVIAAARDLVLLARRHGYRRDELVSIIETLDV